MILDVIVNIAAVNSVEEEILFGKLIGVFLLGVACVLAWDFVIIIKLFYGFMDDSLGNLFVGSKYSDIMLAF